MTLEAQSKAQIFQSFDHNRRWRDYWEEYGRELIETYAAMNWRLIPIAHRSKKPFAGYLWSGLSLDRERAFEFFRSGANLAVVAGRKLVILDIDTKDFPERFLNTTLSMITPRGYCLFLHGPFDERLMKRLKKKYPQFDTVRSGEMYELLPPSETCLGDRGNHQCAKHDWRVREWRDLQTPIRPFRQVAKEILEW